MKMKIIIIFLLCMFHLVNLQISSKSLEDDNELYNYEVELSESEELETTTEIPTTLEPTASIEVTTDSNTTESSTTESSTTETYTTTEITTTTLSDDSEESTTPSPGQPQDWDSWPDEKLISYMKHEYYSHLVVPGVAGSHYEYKMLCFLLSHTFRSAIKDLRRYYKIRTLYEKNVQYEIGYVTQEIIFRYSHVLEMYHQVQKIFDSRPDTKYAPTKYVFIIYSNVLDECKHIIHLCHMLNVIEEKYRAKPMQSVFTDPVVVNETITVKKKNDKQQIVEDKRKAKMELLLQQKVVQKKKRKNYLKLWQQSTTRKAKVKLHPWPLLYGWSIEDW